MNIKVVPDLTFAIKTGQLCHQVQKLFSARNLMQKDFIRLQLVLPNIPIDSIFKTVINFYFINQILLCRRKSLKFCTYSVPIEIKKPLNFLKGFILLLAGAGLEPVTFGL